MNGTGWHRITTERDRMRHNLAAKRADVGEDARRTGGRAPSVYRLKITSFLSVQGLGEKKTDSRKNGNKGQFLLEKVDEDHGDRWSDG